MALANAINDSQQGMAYQTTGGVWSGVDGGAAGQVLTSNGTGVSPTFQAAGSGPSYSAGNFTPTLVIGGSSVGITYFGQFGRYVQIGNLVFVSATVQLTSFGGLAGSVSIAGFPFLSIAAAGTELPTLALGFSFVTLSANYTCGQVFVNPGSTTFALDQIANNGSILANITAANISNSSEFYVTGCYYTT